MLLLTILISFAIGGQLSAQINDDVIMCSHAVPCANPDHMCHNGICVDNIDFDEDDEGEPEFTSDAELGQEVLPFNQHEKDRDFQQNRIGDTMAVRGKFKRFIEEEFDYDEEDYHDMLEELDENDFESDEEQYDDTTTMEDAFEKSRKRRSVNSNEIDYHQDDNVPQDEEEEEAIVKRFATNGGPTNDDEDRITGYADNEEGYDEEYDATNEDGIMERSSNSQPNKEGPKFVEESLKHSRIRKSLADELAGEEDYFTNDGDSGIAEYSNSDEDDEEEEQEDSSEWDWEDDDYEFEESHQYHDDDGTLSRRKRNFFSNYDLNLNNDNGGSYYTPSSSRSSQRYNKFWNDISNSGNDEDQSSLGLLNNLNTFLYGGSQPDTATGDETNALGTNNNTASISPNNAGNGGGNNWDSTVGNSMDDVISAANNEDYSTRQPYGGPSAATSNVDGSSTRRLGVNSIGNEIGTPNPNGNQWNIKPQIDEPIQNPNGNQWNIKPQIDEPIQNPNGNQWNIKPQIDEPIRNPNGNQWNIKPQIDEPIRNPNGNQWNIKPQIDEPIQNPNGNQWNIKPQIDEPIQNPNGNQWNIKPQIDEPIQNPNGNQWNIKPQIDEPIQNPNGNQWNIKPQIDEPIQNPNGNQWNIKPQIDEPIQNPNGNQWNIKPQIDEPIQRNTLNPNGNQWNIKPQIDEPIPSGSSSASASEADAFSEEDMRNCRMYMRSRGRSYRRKCMKIIREEQMRQDRMNLGDKPIPDSPMSTTSNSAEGTVNSNQEQQLQESDNMEDEVTAIPPSTNVPGDEEYTSFQGSNTEDESNEPDGVPPFNEGPTTPNNGGSYSDNQQQFQGSNGEDQSNRVHPFNGVPPTASDGSSYSDNQRQFQGSSTDDETIAINRVLSTNRVRPKPIPRGGNTYGALKYHKPVLNNANSQPESPSIVPVVRGGGGRVQSGRRGPVHIYNGPNADYIRTSDASRSSIVSGVTLITLLCIAVTAIMSMY